MSLLSRKGILAIAAVIDVALYSGSRPVSAKALATRHGLPPRHLEPVLQALVHDGILKGIRGPRGGYELGRDRNGITATEILRAAGTVDDGSDAVLPGSLLVGKVVLPAIAQAEKLFAAALGEISLNELVQRASKFPELAGRTMEFNG
jgi:Rrf2 family transcriptional regulator, iron-sulfur cluster assembly transcription factor